MVCSFRSGTFPILEGPRSHIECAKQEQSWVPIWTMSVSPFNCQRSKENDNDTTLHSVLRVRRYLFKLVWLQPCNCLHMLLCVMLRSQVLSDAAVCWKAGVKVHDITRFPWILRHAMFVVCTAWPAARDGQSLPPSWQVCLLA